MKLTYSRPLAVLAAAALSACAAGPPTAPLTKAALTAAATATPAQWQAPLPHGGQMSELSLWWQQFNDPVLVQLIDAAQGVSPSIASAASRIEQSRARRTASGAALLPALDASASATRGRQDFVSPLGSIGSVGVQAAWEIDLFGGRRAARTAAQARLDGSQAAWHDARV